MPRGGKAVAFGLLVAVLVLSWIQPIWPFEQGLHDSGAVIAMAWLLWHDRRWPMGVGAFSAICVFLAVHAVAAHWLYSNVPYDAWLRTAIGWSPHAAFGWERNHFDRFVHLLYGLCFAPALAQYAASRWHAAPRTAALLALMAIVTTSVIYEWVEWAIALGMAPDQAEAYNGQQGDPWDAHMDMLLATLGAALVLLPSLGRRTVAHG